MDNKPVAYDLSSKGDRVRLIRETRGYLHTCRREHHGTDWDGRAFAIEALECLSETALVPPQADREAVREAVKAMKEAIKILNETRGPFSTEIAVVVPMLTASISKLGEE